MRNHTVTLPDGRKVKVQAPEESDDVSILIYALHAIILEETKAREKHDQEIERLQADVSEMLAEFRKITDWALKKQGEKPVTAPLAPTVKISPEIKVISDPAITKAINESRQAAKDNAEMIFNALSKLGTAASSKVDPAASPVEWSLDIVHETDTHSPRFGRMKRVIVKPG
jgi:hypothetical protein